MSSFKSRWLGASRGSLHSEVTVLDTAAITAGFAPASSANYTTPKVVEELRKFSVDWESWVGSVNVRVVEPSSGSVRAVSNAASASGDSAAMSPADIGVVALAYDLHVQGVDPVVVTDDYAVSNVCEWMGIRHWRATLSKPVFRKLRWIWFCPTCSKRYAAAEAQAAERVCEACGSKLKRRSVGGGRR